jgi:hypothetical protein
MRSSQPRTRRTPTQSPLSLTGFPAGIRKSEDYFSNPAVRRAELMTFCTLELSGGCCLRPVTVSFITPAFRNTSKIPSLGSGEAWLVCDDRASLRTCSTEVWGALSCVSSRSASTISKKLRMCLEDETPTSKWNGPAAPQQNVAAERQWHAMTHSGDGMGFDHSLAVLVPPLPNPVISIGLVAAWRYGRAMNVHPLQHACFGVRRANNRVLSSMPY